MKSRSPNNRPAIRAKRGHSLFAIRVGDMGLQESLRNSAESNRFAADWDGRVEGWINLETAEGRLRGGFKTTVCNDGYGDDFSICR